MNERSHVWDDPMAGMAGRIRGRRGDDGDGAPPGQRHRPAGHADSQRFGTELDQSPTGHAGR